MGKVLYYVKFLFGNAPMVIGTDEILNRKERSLERNSRPRYQKSHLPSQFHTHLAEVAL